MSGSTPDKPLEVFIVNDSETFYAVAVGDEFGMVRSEDERTRRRAWRGLVRLLADLIVSQRSRIQQLQRQLMQADTCAESIIKERDQLRRDLATANDQLQRHRDLAAAPHDPVDDAVDDVMRRNVEAVRNHRDDLLTKLIDIRAILDRPLERDK